MYLECCYTFKYNATAAHGQLTPSSFYPIPIFFSSTPCCNAGSTPNNRRIVILITVVKCYTYPMLRTLYSQLLLLLLCGGVLRCQSTVNTLPPTSSVDQIPDLACPDVYDTAISPEPNITIGNGTPASCTFAALKRAVDSLAGNNSGGTIRFATGGEPASIFITQPLQLQSSTELLVIDGSNLISFNAENRTQIIVCKNHTRLALRNIKLINGLTDSSGGALLHPWYGTLDCYQVSFENNHCSMQGPEFGGGAVFAGGLDHARFIRCAFIGNSASNGGALLNRGTNLTIAGCVFKNNSATGNGGGKDAGSSGQGGLGGGLYSDGMNYTAAVPFTLCASTFSDNRSHCHGSAVFTYYYKNHPGTQGAAITNCIFTNNSDSGTITSAGALYHEGAPLHLQNCAFIGNSSLKHAGALFIGADAPSRVTNCTFYGNVTTGNGGAIFGGKQSIMIWNCTFCRNVGSYGPAIFNDTPDAVTVYNTLFVDNEPITNPYAYRNCTTTYTSGAQVIQWPPTKANNNPDNRCIESARFIDPLLDSLGSNGGPTPTMALRATSPGLSTV